ncbi:hypothetical protein [Miltoncostaea oceani]|uniref:hypothetical protein n=1 Tax=Miltoncostaea oceani TaxID=2843216 RepID=UPI001C3C6D5C|nr:hypothetical protein [Miltoncostaea oceani]
MSVPASETGAAPADEQGRCSTCHYIRSFSTPLRAMYFCRARRTEMTVPQKDAVRDCSLWRLFTPRAMSARAREFSASGEMASDLMRLEEQMFQKLAQSLGRHGADLKTLMLLAYPSITSADQISWLDELGLERTPAPLADLVPVLIHLRYEELIPFLEPFIVRESAAQTEESAGA